MTTPTPPRNEKAKNRAARLRARLDQLAAQVTEILAQRINQLAEGKEAETKQLVDLIKSLTEVSIGSSWNQKLSRAILANPSIAQHQPGNSMTKKIASAAARARKAATGDRREGAVKARESENSPHVLPSFPELQQRLQARGFMAGMPLPPDDDPVPQKPASSTPEPQEGAEGQGQDPSGTMPS